jgi:hypothetical protein
LMPASGPRQLAPPSLRCARYPVRNETSMAILPEKCLMPRRVAEKRKVAKMRRKFVMAFTHVRDDLLLPPAFVVGELEVHYVPGLDYDQNLVEGVPADESTITPISNPTPELMKLLKKKSLEWERQDNKLAKKRAREDGRFREESLNREFEVHLVRKDRSEAFSAFCNAMTNENRRLTAERRAEVEELVKRFNKRKVQKPNVSKVTTGRPGLRPARR